ncbi:hypothetical protein [Megalodesulfovibrio gigas]|uniref:Uncharacterized protein n=1 Tax=Megalodesulfovibrio gigas (strain ATCC 19364 / DSM 1382 / NCIMB 9332 / VKM B-1759) TaxID=1121448 RepID=T2GFQ3_MEGG1|nr:hypothetical protein [Megalodesulfovibrio gigas]AGW14757.1 hypothetical protein DGI_3039 [Megalodesulfovibrio gigas DSM 1382 = ATCC 19364]
MDVIEQQVHSGKKLILVGITDLLILVELCVAMYYAAQSESVNTTFMTIFFGAAIPTLCILFILLRALRKHEKAGEAAPQTATTIVPGVQTAQG